MEMVMMSLSPSQSNSKPKMNFEETELRLGLPGKNGNGKRWFSETSSMDLKLNLSSKETSSMDSTSDNINNNNIDQPLTSTNDQVKPPTETQVVGWPPVRNFRKNIVAAVQKSSSDESGGALVKVSMDGAPYLRKVDLKMYKSYKEFSDALSKMFSLFTTTAGNYEAKGMINFMEEKKLMDLLNNSDYVPSYEDKDGDWMLVGDVPWEMFVESCKRLRIMKGTEAAGLAPRVMEKCKNRS